MDSDLPFDLATLRNALLDAIMVKAHNMSRDTLMLAKSSIKRGVL
jgi:hypothetical protein